MPTRKTAVSMPEALSLKRSAPDIHIHYLGHSSFILALDNGVTILTDYGQSCAYGLDSPIYDLGDFQPTLVTLSHRHPDHDRGMTFAAAILLDGQDLSMNKIDIQAVRVSENHEGDNYGYLITYKGFTIFHAGDSQGDMVELSTNQEIQERLRRQLPDKIDLLLAPIDWMKNIIPEAVAYIHFLQPRRVIPMHYWSPSIKSEFLAELESSGGDYEFVEVGGPGYDVYISGPAVSSIEVISLIPSAPIF